MAGRSFQLPEAVRLRAASAGHVGARWIAGLDDSVARLERAWNLKIAETMAGGSASLVLAARRADGTSAILKLPFPEEVVEEQSADAPAIVREAQALRLADGRGYARLLASDDATGALPLERLGKPLADLGLPVRRQMAIICATLREAWQPMDNPGELITGAAKARWLAEFIGATWQRLGEPCAVATRDLALAFARERETAHDGTSHVLVHGDAHAYNTLRADDGGSELRFKFIDPDGLFTEPAYDLAIPMREYNEELLGRDALSRGRERCGFLSAETGVAEEPIWQWGFIERVSTGLLLLQIGMKEEGAATLSVADRWTRFQQP